MKLVYKFKYNGELNDVLMDYCKSAKDLYNQALYLVKKELKSNDNWLSYYELDKILKTTKNLEGDINYYKNKSQVSQQVIKKLSNNKYKISLLFKVTTFTFKFSSNTPSLTFGKLNSK